MILYSSTKPTWKWIDSPRRHTICTLSHVLNADRYIHSFLNHKRTNTHVRVVHPSPHTKLLIYSSSMLTRNQLYQLEYNSHNYDTVQKIVSTLRSWWFLIEEKHITTSPSDFLKYFIKIQKQQHMNAIRSWEIQTRYTPTVNSSILFNNVSDPKPWKIYHIAWAYKGAKFRLRKIEFPYAYMDNPKHKRDELLKVKLSDLRERRINS